MNKRRLIPLFAAFVLWGSQYVISKIALRTVPPVTLLALRYLVSVPTLFIVLRLRHALTPVEKGDWPILFAIGFTGYFASFCLQMLGINRLTGSVSSLLGAMNPIFIPILAALFLHERITPAKIACVALSMAGVVVIVGVDGTVDASGRAADARQRLSLVYRFYHHSARQRAIRSHADRADRHPLRAAIYRGLVAHRAAKRPLLFHARKRARRALHGCARHRRHPFPLELQSPSDGRELLLHVLPHAAARLFDFGRSVSARSRHTRLRYRRADDLLRHRGGGDFRQTPESVISGLAIVRFLRYNHMDFAFCFSKVNA